MTLMLSLDYTVIMKSVSPYKNERKYSKVKSERPSRIQIELGALLIFIHFNIVAFLPNATIEYSSGSVCMCLCFCTITQKEIYLGTVNLNI